MATAIKLWNPLWDSEDKKSSSRHFYAKWHCHLTHGWGDDDFQSIAGVEKKHSPNSEFSISRNSQWRKRWHEMWRRRRQLNCNDRRWVLSMRMAYEHSTPHAYFREFESDPKPSLVLRAISLSLFNVQLHCQSTRRVPFEAFDVVECSQKVCCFAFLLFPRAHFSSNKCTKQRYSICDEISRTKGGERCLFSFFLRSAIKPDGKITSAFDVIAMQWNVEAFFSSLFLARIAQTHNKSTIENVNWKRSNKR